MLGIIDSMTPQERRNPKIIDPSRRNRIARGAGVQVQEVNALLKQFDMMAPMMKAMAGKGIGPADAGPPRPAEERHVQPRCGSCRSSKGTPASG